MKTPIAFLVVVSSFVAGPFACSSSSSNGGGGGSDAATGHDAPVTDDSQGNVDSSSSSSGGNVDASGDAPVDSAKPPVCKSDAGDAVPGDFANAPECQPGTCTLSGTLGGSAVSQNYPSSAFNFANGTSLDAGFGTGGHIHLVMVSPVAIGEAQTTVGTMTMPSEGPMAGANLCMGNGSELQFEVNDADQEVRFILRCLTGTCTATPTALAGEIQGCCAK
jgi:hypothetical protein